MTTSEELGDGNVPSKSRKKKETPKLVDIKLVAFKNKTGWAVLRLDTHERVAIQPRSVPYTLCVQQIELSQLEEIKV